MLLKPQNDYIQKEIRKNMQQVGNTSNTKQQIAQKLQLSQLVDREQEQQYLNQRQQNPMVQQMMRELQEAELRRAAIDQIYQEQFEQKQQNRQQQQQQEIPAKQSKSILESLQMLKNQPEQNNQKYEAAQPTKQQPTQNSFANQRNQSVSQPKLVPQQMNQQQIQKAIEWKPDQNKSLVSQLKDYCLTIQTMDQQQQNLLIHVDQESALFIQKQIQVIQQAKNDYLNRIFILIQLIDNDQQYLQQKVLNSSQQIKPKEQKIAQEVVLKPQVQPKIEQKEPTIEEIVKSGFSTPIIKDQQTIKKEVKQKQQSPLKVPENTVFDKVYNMLIDEEEEIEDILKQTETENNRSETLLRELALNQKAFDELMQQE
ncbi:Hypothetical_protein [Hexamita inflata]|uniref:Hypothetical_protein n=1 Tax=Hexamita inflata TaxID=28002 RepID=A0AA86TEF7_9EUKA|nr:Hypothetical protein HINF_LOCUS3075 [Hexamita inflata]